MVVSETAAATTAAATAGVHAGVAAAAPPLKQCPFEIVFKNRFSLGIYPAADYANQLTWDRAFEEGPSRRKTGEQITRWSVPYTTE